MIKIDFLIVLGKLVLEIIFMIVFVKLVGSVTIGAVIERADFILGLVDVLDNVLDAAGILRMFHSRNLNSRMFRRRSVNCRLSRSCRIHLRRWIDKDCVIRDGRIGDFVWIALTENVWRAVVPFGRPSWKVREGVFELVVERVLDVGRVGR